MAIESVALIFDNQVRPDTTGGYCLRALQKLLKVQHYLPSELAQVPRHGFDLYLNIDDGLEYRLPRELHPCAWWAIDTHLNFEWYRTKGPDFDLVFTAQRDGAERLGEAIRTPALWLPLACDPDIHRKHDVPKEFDVCFVGHFFSGVRAELLDVLRRRFRNSFIGQRFFDDMAKTYSASRVTFNRSLLNDINMRVFEALACGSLLVTNDLSDNGQEDLFRDGTHLATYRDAEEMVDKIAYYLKRDAVREQIAAAGRAEVLGRDTYRHRMEWLLAEVDRGLPISRPRWVVEAAPPLEGPPAGPAAVPRASSSDLASVGRISNPSGAADGLEIRPTIPEPLVGSGMSRDPRAVVNRALLDLIPVTARRVLLLGPDLGGQGDGLRAQPGVEVTAWDLGPGVDPAQRRRTEQALCGEAPPPESQPASGSFDAVACAGALERLREPLAGLRRLRAWLRPAGALVASVTNVRHHSVVRSLMEGNWSYEPGGILDDEHLHFFTRRDLERLLYRAGFVTDELRPVHGPADEDYLAAARRGEVHIGSLHLGGLPPEQAEDFLTQQYLLRATAAPAAAHGLTSIVILTHNQRDYTRQCVDSLCRHTDEPYELIFVDNGSDDGTVEYLASLPGVRLIRNERNLGFPAAANQGIGAATGRQVLLLNNDCVLPTGWLRPMLAALDRDPAIGLVGPCSNFVSGEQRIDVPYTDLTRMDAFAWDWGQAQRGRTEDTDRLVGFCLLIRRAVIDKIGLLDEQFGLGCFEDDDYCRRALAAGFRAVIARDAFVHHYGCRTFVGDGVDFDALMSHNQALYEAKWRQNGAAVSGIQARSASDGTQAPTQARGASDEIPSLALRACEEPTGRGHGPAGTGYLLRAAAGGGLLLERTGVELSLCMIVRNNEKTLRQTLESIKPWVDEMIVLDTGSEDRTPVIARELGARVYHFPWPNSFAVARNESLQYARGRWIFWMDSDDTIDEVNGRKLRALVRQPMDPSVQGFYAAVHCPGPGEDGAYDVTVVHHVKLFRNDPRIRFERRIHEQVLMPIRRLGGALVETDVFVVHSGYDHSPEGQQRKKARDLFLLGLELQDDPNDPFTLFNLGMTHNDFAEYAQAITYLERCRRVSRPEESHLRKAYSLLVFAYAGSGHPEAAWEACAAGLELYPEDVELRFRKALLLHDRGRLEESARLYEELLRSGPVGYPSSMDRGITGFKARQNLAAVYTDLGDLARAEEQWRRVTAEVPRYRHGWGCLGEILLRQGKVEEAAGLAETLGADPRLRGVGLVLRARLDERAGSVEAAGRHLRQAVADFPADLDARAALGRFLFERGPVAEAEQALRELVRLAPDGAAYHNLGAILSRQGRHREAADAYRRSLALRPKSPATSLQLAEALHVDGRPDEAIAACEDGLRLAPGDPALTQLLAEVRRRKEPPGRWEGQTPPASRGANYTVRLRGRTVEVPYAPRGPVDEAILRDVWERDVYGVQCLPEAPEVVVDLGAHLGAFALLARTLWPRARVLACEADADNFRLLGQHLRGCPDVEAVHAAVVGDEVSEVTFHAVADKAGANSGGGSCVRPEPGSVPTRVPALSVGRLWQSRGIGRCQVLKLDCEGAEVAILRALAGQGALGAVQHIVGEWHARDARAETVAGVKAELQAVLEGTHVVTFKEHGRGREGHFTATALRWD